MNIPVQHYSIDFEILEKLAEEGRNVPSILGDDLDKHRNYVSQRLNELKRYGMVKKIGERNIGLYEITELGKTALENRDVWETDHDEYQDLITEAADS